MFEWNTFRVGSPQALTAAERRLVARWALACAERVLPLFDADAATTAIIVDARARTRAYSRGESTTAAEIALRGRAGAAANAATTLAGIAAGKSMAQAAAVAHMGAHALGAAAYAAKAISLAHPRDPDAIADEIEWQIGNLTPDERTAVKLLPLLGTDTSGPLGPGLLSRGVLGDVIREIQDRIR